MILKYGAYAHDRDEVGFRLEYRSIFDKFNRRMGDIQTWNIIGVKQATSQADLTTKLTDMETAYSLDGSDLIFEDNSGAQTRHTVTSANTFGGVKIAHLGYPKGPWNMHTEYGPAASAKRTFQIVANAEIRVGNADVLYAFRERVTQSGTGGPKQRYMGSLVGTPVLQTLRQQTVIRVVQEGYVIGRGQILTAPGPLALGTELVDLRSIAIHSPKDIRSDTQKELFQTSYRYVFEALTSPVAQLSTPSIGTIP